MEKNSSFNYRSSPKKELQSSFNGDFGPGVSDRRFAFSRQASFQQYREPQTPIPNDSSWPFLSRTVSSIDIPPDAYTDEENVKFFGVTEVSAEKLSVLWVLASVFRIIRSGNRYIKRLFVLILLNVAYSTTELGIGLFTGHVGKPDGIYTYGYKWLEVLSTFTNDLFLLFMSFSLAVEALHAFIEDESEHKHYLIVSAVTNLLFYFDAHYLVAYDSSSLRRDVVCRGKTILFLFFRFSKYSDNHD